MSRDALLASLRALAARDSGSDDRERRAVTHRIVRELELSRAPSFYSWRVSYAGTIPATPLNGIRDARPARGGLRGLLAKKFENALVRLPLSFRGTGPLWRLALAGRALDLAMAEADGNYERLVRWAFELLRGPVEELDVRSPDCYGPDLVDIGGRKLAYRTLRELSRLLHIKRLVPRPATVVELGAGLGEMTRLMLATGYARRAIVIDEAPALAYAQCLLAAQFPAERLSFFDPRRSAVTDALCSFLTPEQAALLPDFDLGVNLTTFHKMPRGAVEALIAAVKAKRPRDFISVNPRQRGDWGFGESEYESWFAPEYRAVSKTGFHSDRPMPELPPDRPGEPGWQLLHFTRA